MELDIIATSIREATEGLNIIWRPNIAIIPIEDTDQAIERREINGHLVAGDFGFYLNIVVPDEDTEMEPDAWAELVVLKLSQGINNLSIYMSNSALAIRNKSRDLASWERKHIGLPSTTQFQESPSEES